MQTTSKATLLEFDPLTASDATIAAHAAMVAAVAAATAAHKAMMDADRRACRYVTDPTAALRASYATRANRAALEAVKATRIAFEACAACGNP